MKSLVTSIVIEASKETIWNALTDFSQYRAWNPFIISVEGKPEAGTLLKNTMLLNGKTQVFTPVVLQAIPFEKLAWLGSLWFKGIFDGQHEFILEEISAHQVRLVQREYFSGILSGPILKLIGKETLANFEKMNQALKQRAEQLSVKA